LDESQQQIQQVTPSSAENPAQSLGGPKPKYESISICVQDLIMLTDFVSLPELIMIFSRGRIANDSILSNPDEALLNIDKI